MEVEHSAARYYGALKLITADSAVLQNIRNLRLPASESYYVVTVFVRECAYEKGKSRKTLRGIPTLRETSQAIDRCT